jgi:hypothetical protein
VEEASAAKYQMLPTKLKLRYSQRMGKIYTMAEQLQRSRGIHSYIDVFMFVFQNVDISR